MTKKISKAEKELRKAEAIASLRGIVKEDTVLYLKTIRIVEGNLGNTYWVAILIVSEGQIANITFGVGRALELKLDDDFNLQCPRYGYNVHLAIAEDLGQLLFGKRLAYISI